MLLRIYFAENQIKSSMTFGQSKLKLNLNKNIYKIIPQKAVSPLDSSGGLQ